MNGTFAACGVRHDDVAAGIDGQAGRSAERLGDRVDLALGHRAREAERAGSGRAVRRCDQPNLALRRVGDDRSLRALVASPCGTRSFASIATVSSGSNRSPRACRQACRCCPWSSRRRPERNLPTAQPDPATTRMRASLPETASTWEISTLPCPSTATRWISWNGALVAGPPSPPNPCAPLPPKTLSTPAEVIRLIARDLPDLSLRGADSAAPPLEFNDQAWAVAAGRPAARRPRRAGGARTTSETSARGGRAFDLDGVAAERRARLRSPTHTAVSNSGSLRTVMWTPTPGRSGTGARAARARSSAASQGRRGSGSGSRCARGEVRRP